MNLTNDIILGQYVPGNSIIHRLHPCFKVIMVLAMMIVIFLAGNPAANLIIALFLVVLITVSGIPVKFILRGLKPLFILLFFTFCLHLFLTPGKVIWEWWILKITEPGLYQGIIILLRLTFLIIVASLLTLTTSPLNLTYSMEQLMAPLRILRFPVHEFSMLTMIALRFIPVILWELDKIVKAQTARGMDFKKGNLFSRLKNLTLLLLPLFISAFKRAEDLALAMEIRCYRGEEGRTRMKKNRVGVKDYLAAAVTLLIVATVVYSRNW